jgi:RNA polymerase sigma-70 factor (ECF subfamily)
MDSSAADTADLRALHAAHAGPLYAFVIRATGDRQAAEEIVQDTFVRAWRAMDRFDPERGDVGAWLFTIARNLVADHYRRRSARPSTPVPTERLERPAPGLSDIDRAVEVWQVSEALHRLSPAHRDAIVAIHLRGASVAETAQQFGVPPGTVKSRVYYGLKALRLALEEMGAVR